MIRTKQILGNIKDYPLKNQEKDSIFIAWYDTRKKIARLLSKMGREVAMHLDSAPLYGINHGDIIYCDKNLVIYFEILPVRVLSIQAKNMIEVAKICYEIGNRHAALFFGKIDFELQTPYELPLQRLVEKLKIKYTIKEDILDSSMRLNVSMPHQEKISKVMMSADFGVTIARKD